MGVYVYVCLVLWSLLMLTEMVELVALWRFRGKRFSAEQVKQADTATGLPKAATRDLQILRMWTQQELFMTTVASSFSPRRDQTRAITRITPAN